MSETETAKLIERLRTREVPGVVTYGAGTGSTVATCFAAPDPDCIAAADALTASLSREAALREALKTIAARREDLAACSRNDYDSGYELATEMCCDIADEALAALKSSAAA